MVDGDKERGAERERRMEANSGLHAAKSFIPIVRFSLVVLCHHTSCLTICPRIRFQILSPSLSLRIRCLSFFHVALFPPAPRRDERTIPSKKPSLEQYFRADRSHKKAKTTSCVSDGANNTWRYRYPGKIDNTFPWNRLNRG